MAFPDSSAQWVYYCGWLSWEGNYVVGANERHFLFGDTLIESIEYTKVFYEESAYGEFPDTSNSVFVGGVREELGKVFYRGELTFDHTILENPDSIPDEILLYDFTTEVGDTIFNVVNYHAQSLYNSVDSIYSIVTGVGSLSTVNGSVRYYSADRWFSYHGDDHEYGFSFAPTECYESYGAQIEGLFGPVISLFEGGCELFCFMSSDYTFDWDSFASCNNVSASELEGGPENRLTYSQNRIISSCALSNSVISVYDVTGKLVLSEIPSVEGVDCSPFTNGIYLAVLISERERSVLKFAVTR